MALVLEERRHPKLPHGAFSQIAISAVEVTPDLREAKVSWSPDHAPGEGGPDSSAAAIAAGLLRVSKAARSARAKRIRLRVRPAARASAFAFAAHARPAPTSPRAQPQHVPMLRFDLRDGEHESGFPSGGARARERTIENR